MLQYLGTRRYAEGQLAISEGFPVVHDMYFHFPCRSWSMSMNSDTIGTIIKWFSKSQSEWHLEISRLLWQISEKSSLEVQGDRCKHRNGSQTSQTCLPRLGTWYHYLETRESIDISWIDEILFVGPLEQNCLRSDNDLCIGDKHGRSCTAKAHTLSMLAKRKKRRKASAPKIGSFDY